MIANTFWDYFRNSYQRDAGLRIDHFLLSKDIVSRLKKTVVDKHARGWEKTSDHAPVWIEIKDNGRITKTTKIRKEG